MEGPKLHHDQKLNVSVLSFTVMNGMSHSTTRQISFLSIRTHPKNSYYCLISASKSVRCWLRWSFSCITDIWERLYVLFDDDPREPVSQLLSSSVLGKRSSLFLFRRSTLERAS